MKKKQKNKIIYICHFLICQIIFLLLFSVTLIYHGPFINYRDYIVSTSMATNKNKFFATWFLSSSEINSILAKTNSSVRDSKEIVNNIDIQRAKKSSTKVKIIDIKETNFKAKLMIISDPSKIFLGIAPKFGHTGATLSEIVKSYNAVGGINAGGFLDDNLMGTGSKPDGIVISNDVVKFKQSGLSKFNVIGFNKNNILIIGNLMTMGEIYNSNLKCAISFGPALVLNGKPLVTKGGTSLQPRSAIGQRKDGTVLLLAIDGREHDSAGANYTDTQDIMLKYGAYNAANLDGGSSTTLNYLGKTINNPCDIAGERTIATAFLIAP
ncbi:phosphodiester glycosidase family protein [Clostridium sp. Mt-5]|uniref:Phosphodiester glycosidase family protein n=2 Tax=Clostridium moutaii TaxID=3240932 RepID=A0ABV4BPJ6_9CLOT